MEREGLVPPEGLSHLGGGGGNYTGVGRLWADMLTAPPYGLRPDERVLDAGCGLGRIAVPLTGHLSPRGAYEGFDVAPESVAWCQEKVTARYPNFRFQVADVYNKRYNPGGRHRAEDYRFPYKSGSFDFVFLASVFTHMLPAEIENYLGEIQRVLRPGGRAVISYFLLNAGSLESIEAGRISKGPRFVHDLGGYRVQNPAVPEVAVAHDEGAVRKLHERAGLEILEPVLYGSWFGVHESKFRQDRVWAVKRA